jgi:hypothetical protein
MWCKWHSVDDAVAGIPPSAWANAIEQHLDTKLDPEVGL